MPKPNAGPAADRQPSSPDQSPNPRAWVKNPVAYRFEYQDGLKATMLLMNGLVDDFTFAAKLQGQAEPLSTLFYLPPLPNVAYSAALMSKVEETFLTGRPRPDPTNAANHGPRGCRHGVAQLWPKDRDAAPGHPLQRAAQIDVLAELARVSHPATGLTCREMAWSSLRVRLLVLNEIYFQAPNEYFVLPNQRGSSKDWLQLAKETIAGLDGSA